MKLKEFYYEIKYSSYGAWGRIFILLLIAGLLYFNATVLPQFSSESQKLIGVDRFFIGQLFFVFVMMFATFGWFTIAIFIIFVLWVITENDDGALIPSIIEFPVLAFKFILKFIGGNWDRRNIKKLFTKENS